MKETTLKTWWKLPLRSVYHTWALGSWDFYFFPSSSANKSEPRILHFGVISWDVPSASPPETHMCACMCEGCMLLLPKLQGAVSAHRREGFGLLLSLPLLGLSAAASSGRNKAVCMRSSQLDVSLGPCRQVMLTPGSLGSFQVILGEGKGQWQYVLCVHPIAHDDGKREKSQNWNFHNPVVNSLRQWQS